SYTESYSSNTRNLFYNCQAIEKVIFPTSVDTIIHERMFYNCKSLKSIEIPEWVTTVNSSAFYNCEALTSITFPKSVSTVMKAAGTDAPSFSGCASLKEINFENPSLDVSLFTIPNNEGLVINCASKTQYDTIVAMGLTNATVNFEIAPGNLMTDGSGYQYAYENGVLTITKVDTTSSTTLSSDLELDFKADVTTIVIGEDTGITVLGANIFDGFAAETVVVPSTLKTIGAASFANMPNLKTVVDHTAYTADNTAGSGIINIMTATSVAADAFSGSCAALSPVVYMGKTVAISGETFAWFAEDASESFFVYPSTKATAFFKANNIAFSYLTEEQTGDSLLRRADTALASSTSTTVSFKWSIDETTGKLTVTPSVGATGSNSSCLYVNSTTTVWHEWKDVWADAIVSFYLVNFGGYRTEWRNSESPFANLPNLKHVHFGTTTSQYRIRKMSGGGGVFENCPSLTTVSYGTDDTYDEEIDLRGWKKLDSYPSKTFYNCASIKKVILPTNLSKTDEAGSYNVSISSDFFNGCTSLTEVEIPACFIAVGQNAFANCPNLKYVKFLGDLSGGVNAAAGFRDSEELTIDVNSYAVAKKFDACGLTKTVVNYPFAGIVNMDGFSVRLTGYNGLRGLFTADWTKITEYEEAGYELLDFGTLVSSAANRANCVLTGEYGNYTVAGNVVNTPIWNKTDGIVGKYLTSSDDALEFAVTVINFAEANYMSNVYFCAYEIWKNPEGEIEILYKDCDGTDYDEMSLARMCSIMYEDGIITEENDTEGMVKDIVDYYEDNRTKNILFIGNSFTYYNQMPTEIFTEVAKAAGREAVVTAITNGGHTLAEFASSTDEFGAKVAEAFKNNSYDIVIIQEQSHRPISNPESFYAAARDLKEMARQNGAELYLYATWGYDADHTSLATYGKDTADMEMKLRAAYQYIGEEMGVPVCHVGAAMTYAFTNSDVSLYQSDNYHPLKTGSTLAAMTIASKIYGFDPASINLTIDGITAENMSALKAAASYVYNNDMSVPEEYKTASSKPLDGKRIIFIGDSFVYWGGAVLDKGYSSEARVSESTRSNDQGFFYQLCKANGMDVNVVNWTFGSHGIGSIMNENGCNVSDSCPCYEGKSHMSYLNDTYFDYVVLSGGRNSSNKYETYANYLNYYKDYFTEANPNVKMLYLVSSGAHNVSVAESFPVEILNNLDEFEKIGYTIVDWGKIVADIVNGDVAVPGATLEYNKNSFVVSRSSSDGYHPNQLAGYITSLMTYIAITGESAVGQPYSFVGDTSVCTASNYYSFDDYVATYYTYNSATTNYPEIFA
ncbi:MAG: leucine-rich repeat protein, partial [Clostridia bacterium]|nr:leucine-rich repeat protein [Clostridia bacterium]